MIYNPINQLFVKKVEVGVANLDLSTYLCIM